MSEIFSLENLGLGVYNTGAKVKNRGFSPNELVELKDSRDQGFKDSSEMIKNYKGLKVWQKALDPF